MALDTQELQYIDPNLYTGSADRTRSVLGEMLYDAVSGAAEGEYIDYLKYTGTADPPAGGSNATLAWDSNIDLKQEPAVSGTILPNCRFPVRLKAEREQFDNDVEWLAYVVGGSGLETNYSGIYSAQSFDDFMFNFELPYSTGQSKRLTEITKDSAGRDPYKVSYNYNYYHKPYEQKAQSISNVTSLPNIYITDLFSKHGFGFHDLDFTTQTVSLMETIDDTAIQALWDSQVVSYFPPHEGEHSIAGHDTFSDSTKNMRDYLSTYAEISVSQSVLDVADLRYRNILFDYSASWANSFMYDFDMYPGAQDARLAKWPYYVAIEFPKFEYYDAEEGGRGSRTPSDFDPYSTGGPFMVNSSVIRHGYSVRMLQLIKEAFLGQNVAMTPQNMSYSLLTSRLTAQSTPDGSVQSSEVTTAADTNVRYVDFMRLMQNAHNIPTITTNDCFVMHGPDIESAAAMDNTGAYRFYNTVASTNIITDLYDYIAYSPDYQIESMSDLFNKAGSSKYREVLAYRIEKQGTSGPSSNQNFWFFNVPAEETWYGTAPSSTTAGTIYASDALQYIDSQVKYGEKYTYKIYAYVLVIGHKYGYSDLAVSRTISQLVDDGTTTTQCLEFYSPYTGEPTEQLFQRWEDNELSGSEADGPLNQFATNAHIIAEGDYGYLADFHITYEPSARLLEIPLGEKQIAVLDNPGPAWEVAPFYFFDNTPRVGFELILEAENSQPPPSGIGGEAQSLLSLYRRSNDILPGENITVDSKSRITNILVFRTQTRPITWNDLTDSLYTSLDLRIEGGEYTTTRTNFIDTIGFSGTYYYTFVGVNDHGIQTHPSSIYEATLVNDNGYTYANFSIVSKLQSSRTEMTQTTNSFQHFVGLVLKQRHTLPDITSVDLTQTAESQLDNLVLGTASELVWDKKFKVRLTSKKTGRKIDLNLTYKSESE